MSSIMKARRALVVLVTALAVAMGMMANPAVSEAQNHRAVLRPGCDWDPHVRLWVQRCDVYSPAMGRHIPVQIQPAKFRGNAGLYMLDGLRATKRQNAWTNDVHAHKKFYHDNITLVMPVGGTASFYADWDGPPMYGGSGQAPKYKWETFLTQELPGYLQRHFGVSPTNNSILGLSMGGTAAINLAGRHPHQFRQALSYSGYLFTTAPGMQTMMRLALLDAGGYNINAMYGSIVSPRRFENDPFNQVGNLRGKDIYISAASGIPSPADASIPPQHQASGAVLEFFSMLSTRAFNTRADIEGVRVTSNYPSTGLHNWNQFGYQLDRTKGRILDVMNAHAL